MAGRVDMGPAAPGRELSGWGLYPRELCHVLTPRSDAEVALAVRARADEAAGRGGLIARGNGRSYGDSAMNPALTLDMRRLNRMLSFDAQAGVLTLEAGVLLADVITTFLPRGWFVPVTPGTKFVTIGGMIAADVHGKNHHKDGCFGNFVEWIELIDASGALVRCSRSENPELFAWTTGGMGLTGVMLRAAIRLLPVETGWIRQRTIVAAGLSQVMQAFEEAAAATYSVAWIDCLAGGARQGRSLLMLGEHATMAELPGKHHADRYAMSSPKKVSVPFSLPSAVLNPLTVKAMNEAYFQAGRRKEGVAYISWDSYFYPLDSILHWNRVYGPRGFMQFQCALPLDTAHAGLSRILDTVGEARSGSFLAVLKRFGAQGDGFSFPMDGYTLTLDFAVSEKATALVDRLAGVTAEHGGRFYLAKDSRLSAAMLDKADERTPSFRAMRAKTGASARFQSLQSQRLLL